MFSLCKYIYLIEALAKIFGYMSQSLMVLSALGHRGDQLKPDSIPAGDFHPDRAIVSPLESPRPAADLVRPKKKSGRRSRV